MSGEKIEIKGSGPNYWRGVGLKYYRGSILTLGSNEKYFNRFNKPMAERAKRKFGVPVNILDIACGPADELKFFQNDKDVHLIATDISSDALQRITRKNAPRNTALLAMDVKDSAIAKNSFECGILMNAVIYSPDKMLRAMFDALRPGGECTVNFTLYPRKTSDTVYTETYLSGDRGIRFLDETLKVEGEPTPIEVKIVDFSKTFDERGKSDTRLRNTGQQIHFKSLIDIERLISARGFEVVGHSVFKYEESSSLLFKNTHVFLLRKPESFSDARG